jgi:hypothetical protein
MSNTFISMSNAFPMSNTFISMKNAFPMNKVAR